MHLVFCACPPQPGFAWTIPKAPRGGGGVFGERDKPVPPAEASRTYSLLRPGNRLASYIMNKDHRFFLKTEMFSTKSLKQGEKEAEP